MCHDEAPLGHTPAVDQADIDIELATGEQLPATLFSTGDGGPGILLISDINGPNVFYHSLAARLATAGFTVLLPDYFFRQGPAAGPGIDSAIARRSTLDEVQTLGDLEAALTRLATLTGTGRLGTLGFCMGGTFALDLASMRDDLVTVAYYGFPVPQASLTMPPPRPIDVVDQLRGPVLAFWGDDDKGVGIDNVRAYVDLATGRNPQFEHEILPGLGHAFLTRADLEDPHDPAGATWQRTLRHFAAHLAR